MSKKDKQKLEKAQKKQNLQHVSIKIRAANKKIVKKLKNQDGQPITDELSLKSN